MVDIQQLRSLMMNRKLIIQRLFVLLLSFFSTVSYGQKIFSVKTNPRVEALSIFFTLATADTLDTKPTPSIYYREVKAYFKPYHEHPSLNWYRKLQNWDGPDLASLGLFLSANYPFTLQIKPAANYVRNSSIDTFLVRFNSFYKDCQVRKFINKHEGEYRRINQKAELYIEKSGILDNVASFYNSKQRGEYIIYTDFLCNHGSNAITITNKKFEGKIIAKVGYIEDKSKKLTDDSAVVFEPALNVVAHECSHIYLKNFIVRYHDRLFKIRDHFLIAANGKKIAEKQWENEIDELLVRACMAQILAQKFGKESGEIEIQNQSKHFKWAKDLYLFMDNYIGNRSQYKSIEDFYPELISFFETHTS